MLPEVESGLVLPFPVSPPRISPVSTTLCSVLDFLFFCVGPQNLPAFQLSGFGFLAFFKLTQMSRISETLTYERLSSFGSVRFRPYQRKIHASLLSLIW